MIRHPFSPGTPAKRYLCRKACCFSARSLLYIGPNLFRPPRIRSVRTAENGEDERGVVYNDEVGGEWEKKEGQKLKGSEGAWSK